MLDQAAQLRELVSRSAGEVLTKTISLATGAAAQKAHGHIIAITSGKGGVGKTNFVINTALTLAKMKRSVVVVDLDLGLANVDIMINVTPKYNLDDVIRGRKELHEIIVEGPHGLKLIPGGSGLPRLADLTDEERVNFIACITALREEFDYVLFDTAAGISKNVVEFVLIADEVVVVTTPEPTAITDAYAMIKVISGRNRDITLYMVLNMVKSEREAETYFRKIDQVARQFLQTQLQYLGCIVIDSCVRESIMKRKPFTAVYPYSPAAQAILTIARTIARRTQAHVKDKKKFFERITALFTESVRA